MESTDRKLLDRVRDALRLRHYSIRTEEAYVNWIKRYIYFHNVRRPAEMGKVQAFLTHLAVKENVAASTQNQALSALLFLYRHSFATHLLESRRQRPEAMLRLSKRKDALRQRPVGSRLPARLAGDRRIVLPHHRGGDARLRGPRDDFARRGLLFHPGRRQRWRGGQALVWTPDEIRSVLGDQDACATGYHPHQIIALGEPGVEPVTVPMLEGWGQIDGRATAYVYLDSVCQAPVTEPEPLRAQLELRVVHNSNSCASCAQTV